VTERDLLLEKLKKVKALADRGSGGERESAAALLERMMKKHGITDNDLEENVVQLYWIRYKTDYERKLLFQLAYMHTGPGHAAGCVGKWTNRKRKEVGITCTAAQYIEIHADFDFYREALAEEMDVFYTAFINKNHLFPPPELEGDLDDTGEVDLVRLEKMKAMMAGIEQRTRHKALPQGDEDEEDLE